MRIAQGDIFSDIEIIENISIEKDKIHLHKIVFPFVVCLSQECDLESDYKASCDVESKKTTNLLHIAIAPAFNFDLFVSGKHWGEIFDKSDPTGGSKSKKDCIIDNEIPRYHYLKFPDTGMPELIIDFKHFFTINRNYIYKNLDKRLCSMDDLFKERISQRFSNFLSRIGLPEV
jgi:hypothetical protein